MYTESKKKKDHRSKHDDLHIAGSCSDVVHAAKKVISIMTIF